VAALFKAWVCGPSLAGIAGSNPAGAWMSVSLECCVLSDRDLCDGLITRPEDSYRMWRIWVWFWSLDNEGALAHFGLLRHEKKIDLMINVSRVVAVMLVTQLYRVRYQLLCAWTFCFSINVTFFPRTTKHVRLDKRTKQVLNLPLIFWAFLSVMHTLVSEFSNVYVRFVLKTNLNSMNSLPGLTPFSRI